MTTKLFVINVVWFKLTLVLFSFLRKDTNSFEIICNCLWKAAPNLLVRFVKEARAVTTVSETSVYLHLARRQSLVSMVCILFIYIKLSVFLFICYQKSISICSDGTE